MTDIKSKSLADIVFEKLEDDILSGVYIKGETLTELKLSKLLQVSRTPIREAIRRLQQENLVKESGKGIEVIGVDINDLRDIYEIRKVTEGKATALCAERITDEQLTELSEILELQEFYTLKNSSDKIKTEDSRFHEKIYEYCGSEIYASMLTSLHRKAQKFRKKSVENTARAALAVKEHRAIFEALKKHDSVNAERLCIEHIQNAEINIIQAINSNS